MKKIILVVLFIVSNTAYANGKWCSGKITNSYIEHTGNVYIIGSWRGDQITLGQALVLGTDGSWAIKDL